MSNELLFQTNSFKGVKYRQLHKLSLCVQFEYDSIYLYSIINVVRILARKCQILKCIKCTIHIITFTTRIFYH